VEIEFVKYLGHSPSYAKTVSRHLQDIQRGRESDKVFQSVCEIVKHIFRARKILYKGKCSDKELKKLEKSDDWRKFLKDIKSNKGFLEDTEKLISTIAKSAQKMLTYTRGNIINPDLISWLELLAKSKNVLIEFVTKEFYKKPAEFNNLMTLLENDGMHSPQTAAKCVALRSVRSLLYSQFLQPDLKTFLEVKDRLLEQDIKNSDVEYLFLVAERLDSIHQSYQDVSSESSQRDKQTLMDANKKGYFLLPIPKCLMEDITSQEYEFTLVIPKGKGEEVSLGFEKMKGLIDRCTMQRTTDFKQAEVDDDVKGGDEGVNMIEATSRKFIICQEIDRVHKDLAQRGYVFRGDRRVKVSSFISEFEKELNNAKECLTNWKQNVESSRRENKELNFFTMRELSLLATICKDNFKTHEDIAFEVAALLRYGPWARWGYLLEVRILFALQEVEPIVDNMKYTANFLRTMMLPVDKAPIDTELKCDETEENWTSQLYSGVEPHKDGNLLLTYGTPNFFALPPQKQLVTVIRLALTDGIRRPEPWRFLICRHTTLAEELEIFLFRMLDCARDVAKLEEKDCPVFCIVGLDCLQEFVQKRFAATLELLLISLDARRKLGRLQYCLAIIAGTGKSIVAEALHPFYRSPILIHRRDLTNFYHINEEDPFLKIFCSDKAGRGKTYKIRQFAKSRNKKLIHIPFSTALIDPVLFIKALHRKAHGEIALFHLDVSSCAGKFLDALPFSVDNYILNGYKNICYVIH
jgi:hypothetical protein